MCAPAVLETDSGRLRGANVSFQMVSGNSAVLCQIAASRLAFNSWGLSVSFAKKFFYVEIDKIIFGPVGCLPGGGRLVRDGRYQRGRHRLALHCIASRRCFLRIISDLPRDGKRHRAVRSGTRGRLEATHGKRSQVFFPRGLRVRVRLWLPQRTGQISDGSKSHRTKLCAVGF